MSAIDANIEYQNLLKLKESGKFIPPGKLNDLKVKIMESSDSSSEDFQKIQWEELKKAINRQINALNKSNIKEVVIELFKLNIVRGKGLLIRAIMKRQLTDSIFIPIYSSLIAIINSKIPEIGELLSKRLVLQFKKNYLRNNKEICSSALVFLGHLVNQRVISEILILQVLQLLLENNSNSSVDLACTLLLVVGKFLTDFSKPAANTIFNKLREILHENKELDDKVRYRIEKLFNERKEKFKHHPILEEELDLVEEEDQETHVIELNGNYQSMDSLNFFHFDNEYEKNEAAYDEIRKDILGSDDEESEEEDDDDASEEDEVHKEVMEIKDLTESRLLDYQKKVYLTVMSSMSSDEAVHKLVKMNMKKKPNERFKDNEVLADMIIKCCSQEKTYSKYYGVIGEKLCTVHRLWQEHFVTHFKKYYATIHQYDTNPLRNIGKFFGHLFAADKLDLSKAWDEIKMTEEDTNPAIRIFIKFVLQEMVEELGINEVKARLIDDEYVKAGLNGMFPVLDVTWNDADHIRFSINFFTAIGLGILTEEMRDVLKSIPPPSDEDQRGRSRSRSVSSRSASYSRSRSGSYSRSRSRSYSRSRSRSYSRSLSPS